MRSRKPDTRATMFTCRELSVCATNVGVYGIVVGVTVTTVTSGGGRGGGGASFEQPAATAAIAHTARWRAKRERMPGIRFIGLGVLGRKKRWTVVEAPTTALVFTAPATVCRQNRPRVPWRERTSARGTQNSGGFARGSAEGSGTPLPLIASAVATQPPPIAL